MPDRSPGSRLRRTALRAASVALALTLATAGAAAAAPTVGSVTLTATPAVTAGDLVEVRIAPADVADVYAYEATLAFDPALLAFEDVTATPDGGFDDVATTVGTVTVRHTRLGTSPALSDDVEPTVLRLRALAAGAATVRVADATFVGTDGATVALTDAAAAAVAVAAAPAPVPSTTPTPTPTVAGPAAQPAPADTPGTAAAAAGRGTRSGAGSLGATGAEVGALAGLAVLALVTGAVLVRRRAVSAR